MIILEKHKSIPPIIQALKIIEPKAFPTAKLLAPLETEKTATKSSGMVVPMLTMVAPIMAVEILSLFAMATAESTNLSPPKIIRARDAIKIKLAKTIFIKLPLLDRLAVHLIAYWLLLCQKEKL